MILSFALRNLFRFAAGGGVLLACAGLAAPPDATARDAEGAAASSPPPPPHIVLVMADDMGWGQTGYYQHPVLKTPHLDAMAEAGLRFDRFYAAAPVCSPTRASVLTGRTNRRTGVESHGYPLRRQEQTIAAALQAAGYTTGHFGKWHLNGMRGPGVPILADDTHHPGRFGFDDWLSVTNFFDVDPIMSREGEFVEFEGDSSEIIVDQALQFIGRQAAATTPSFTVIWYGSPHNPFMASQQDQQAFTELPEASQKHYAELVAMDRSIGALRQGLRDLQIADETLVWFCSDNGGLPKITPDTVGGLRGHKGTMYEGGLRVPAILEWPQGIPASRVTQHPAVVMDIFPTIAEIVGLPPQTLLSPQDGQSLTALFDQELSRRAQPIPFQCFGNTVILDNDYKLIHFGGGKAGPRYELYNLAEDPHEQHNLWPAEPPVARKLLRHMKDFQASVKASVAGKDYPAGRVLPGEPQPRFWMGLEEYRPYLDDWKSRPEYGDRIRRHLRRSN